jgi:hypothetical protein
VCGYLSGGSFELCALPLNENLKGLFYFVSYHESSDFKAYIDEALAHKLFVPVIR